MSRKFNEYKTRADQNPVEALNELEYLRGQIFQCGNAYLQDPIVFTRFMDSLPSEYEVTKETLASTTELTRDTLIRVAVPRFNNIDSKKAAGVKAAKASEQAFLARDCKKGQRSGRGGKREDGATADTTLWLRFVSGLLSNVACDE
ncbi:unnamed protein product [Ectocarpus sp. CCAP 1310/34]|nr:unnamed protein product [Ectocarpus sp. CCAP 1310/34]